MRFNIVGNSFAHDHSSTMGKKAKNIEWNFGSKSNPITFYVDDAIPKALDDKNDGKKKFAFLLESKEIKPHIYRDFKKRSGEYIDLFEQIYTHADEFLNWSENIKWIPAYGVSLKKWGGKTKDKNLSMISSSKIKTPLQEKRIKIAKKLKGSGIADVYGKGFNEIDTKNKGLDQYRFSVAFENAEYPTYFTEKILDCFASKTIPIYKGTKNILNYFNGNGILFYDDVKNDLGSLDKSIYDQKIDAINRNYELVKDYDVLEDWIFNNYFYEYNNDF